jgi:alpha-glucosidase
MKDAEQRQNPRGRAFLRRFWKPPARSDETARVARSGPVPGEPITERDSRVPPAANSPAAAVHWWQTGIIYQIYPRSFEDSNCDGVGDLPGILRRLDHIVELGADAIWLSPIFRSPMADFGYDISDYTDIDPLFGSLDQFD